jgi:hypothetical protein
MMKVGVKIKCDKHLGMEGVDDDGVGKSGKEAG